MIPLGSSVPKSGDPAWNSVVLRCPFDSTLTDVSNSAHTLTASGNAAVSTGMSKFGGGSAYFDGAGSYVTAAASSDFALGSIFTIEFWFRAASVMSRGVVIATANEDDTLNSGFEITTRTSNLYFAISDGGGADQIVQTGYMATNTWYHFAIVADGANVKMYINGLDIYTPLSWSGALTSTALRMGGNLVDGGDSFFGFLDDVRITKGVARYSGAFTAPTTPYQTS